MEKQQSTSMKPYLTVLALLGWFALVTQFYINMTSNLASVPELLIRYFSYFTITTNLIVAICCTTLVISPNSEWGNFFSRQKTLAAITVYIVVVGIIYNVILRFLWKPEGLQMIVDELLHSVIPFLFLLYWLFFVFKDQLNWKDALPWLIYPFVYTVFILVRGSVSGFYPYPFINIGELGLEKAFINSVGIAIVFLVLSLLVIAIGKLLNKKKTIKHD